MRTTIQAKSHTGIFLLTVLVLVFSVSLLSAQVSVKDESPIDIRFTSGNTQISQSSYIFSLQELNQLTGRFLDTQTENWEAISISDNSEQNHYLSENRQFISVGRVGIEDFQHTSLFALSLKNESDQNMSELLVAFDMKYDKSAFTKDYDLSLIYRVNNSDWITAEGARFSTSNLNAGDEQWNSISIQLNIDDIFLRSEDEIDLVWVFDTDISSNDFVPLFIQRIEAEVRISDHKPLDRGSVIITEIMPPFTIDGTLFEYIELYNPAETPISLKGIEIVSSIGSHVIQRDVIIDPYEILVLSNADISDLQDVRNNYFYSGSILPNSGRIELRFNSHVIANATFDAADPGVSLYIDNVTNAFDGYTSMRNLLPSEEVIFNDIFGSPGYFSETISLYKKTITNGGWHLISFPGFLNERLSRSSDVHYYAINGERLMPQDILPAKPIFVYKRGDESFTFYVEEDIRHRQRSSEQSTLNAFPAFGMNSVSSGQPHRVNSPIVNLWDSRKNDFKLSFTEDLVSDIWSPLFVNSELNDTDQTRSGNTIGMHMDRYIPFTLNEGSGNQMRRLDSAILGFMEQPAGMAPIRYDLPKLSLTLPHVETSEANHLFLTFEESGFITNTFTHLPYNPEKVYRVGIGTEMVMQSANMVIEWNLSENIPDDWILTFEDSQTGISVDMREVNQYRFRSSGKAEELTEVPDTDRTEVSILRATDRNRFYINMQPFEAIIEDENNSEKPGVAELRPNYPNPFNPTTNITFYLPEERPVRLGVYNIVGQQVALLMDDTVRQGEHSVVWDATNKPSGIYIVQLETGNRTLTRKITLIK